MAKSRLLMKEQPLVVDRTLATLIGLNEALVLQQIEYWVNIKETSDKKGKRTIKENYADGFYWTYNTVEEWAEEFPFWSYDTVKRTLKKLRDNNYVVTGNYNEKAYDRTLWYRVNHEELIKLDEKNSLGANCTNEETSGVQEEKSSEGLKTDISANCPNGKVQNAPMQKGNMPQPIPKTSTKTSTEISSSSSSKGETPDSIHPLVELFNDSICELKKTTTVKFMKYVEKYDKEFIEALIAYCEERNAKSYSYFEKAIERYIADGITTAEDMAKSIENFKDENRTKKNRALKAKDKKKQEEAFEESINDRMMDDLAGGYSVVDEKVELVGEDVGEKIKGILATEINEVSFNTWIKGLNLRLNGDTVVAGCPNNFTKEIIEKRYSDLICKAIKLTEVGEKLEVVVVAD